VQVLLKLFFFFETSNVGDFSPPDFIDSKLWRDDYKGVYKGVCRFDSEQPYVTLGVLFTDMSKSLDQALFCFSWAF